MDEETSQRLHLHWARIAIRAAPEMIPASVKVAMGGWVYELPLWVENGLRVVFSPSLEIEKCGDGVPHGITVGGGSRGGGRETTRGSNVFRARGAAKRESYGPRRFSNFESRNGFWSGPHDRRVNRWNGPVGNGYYKSSLGQKF